MFFSNPKTTMHIYITNTHNESNSHQQKEKKILKRYVKSPCLHPLFGAPLNPKPVFQPQIAK